MEIFQIIGLALVATVIALLLKATDRDGFTDQPGYGNNHFSGHTGKNYGGRGLVKQLCGKSEH